MGLMTKQADRRVGREAPYSLGYEQALLAICMLEGGQESLVKCIDFKISAASFYIPAHKEIFKTCLELYKKGSPINVLTITEQLRSTGTLERAGGSPYLNEIVDRIDAIAGLTFYIQKVKDLEIARNLVRFFTNGLEEAYRGISNVDIFLDHVENNVLTISQERVVQSALPLHVPLEQAGITITKMFNRENSIHGVASGFHDLDRLTGGFRPGEMIVLAARPSIGKTALALNIAENVVLSKNSASTLFFSLEMSAEQLAMRMICSCGRINIVKLRAGFSKHDGMISAAKTAEMLKNAPLWIDETASLTILELRAKARRLHAQHTLGFVIVDYLQLLTGTDAKVQREQQIAEISRGVKSLAKELNVPVLVLSQLNRESEKERRLPRLSDLRESGSIEQDADLVLLLSKNLEDDAVTVEADDAVARNLIIAKNRNGPIGTVHLTFLKSFTRFENYTKK